MESAKGEARSYGSEIRSAEPVTWMKWKYRVFKARGRFKSSHNDSGKSRSKPSRPTDYDPADHVFVYDAGRGCGRMVHATSSPRTGSEDALRGRGRMYHNQTERKGYQ